MFFKNQSLNFLVFLGAILLFCFLLYSNIPKLLKNLQPANYDLFFVEDLNFIDLNEKQKTNLNVIKNECNTIGEIKVAKSMEFGMLDITFIWCKRENRPKPILNILLPDDKIEFSNYSFYEKDQKHILESDNLSLEISGEEKNRWKGYVKKNNKTYLIEPLGDRWHTIRQIQTVDITKETL